MATSDGRHRRRNARRQKPAEEKGILPRRAGRLRDVCLDLGAEQLEHLGNGTSLGPTQLAYGVVGHNGSEISQQAHDAEPAFLGADVARDEKRLEAALVTKGASRTARIGSSSPTASAMQRPHSPDRQQVRVAAQRRRNDQPPDRPEGSTGPLAPRSRDRRSRASCATSPPSFELWLGASPRLPSRNITSQNELLSVLSDKDRSTAPTLDRTRSDMYADKQTRRTSLWRKNMLLFVRRLPMRRIASVGLVCYGRISRAHFTGACAETRRRMCGNASSVA